MNLYSAVYSPRNQTVIWVVKAETEEEAITKVMKMLNKKSKMDLYVWLLEFETDGTAYLGEYSE